MEITTFQRKRKLLRSKWICQNYYEFKSISIIEFISTCVRLTWIEMNTMSCEFKSTYLMFMNLHEFMGI